MQQEMFYSRDQHKSDIEKKKENTIWSTSISDLWVFDKIWVDVFFWYTSLQKYMIPLY